MPKGFQRETQGKPQGGQRKTKGDTQEISRKPNQNGRRK